MNKNSGSNNLNDQNPGNESKLSDLNKKGNIPSRNIILKNKIIKLSENKINLKSLSLVCELSILMSGESSFYIFSRVKDSFNERSTLCIITKELESARKFVTFCFLDNSNNKDNNTEYVIKEIKRQEIPKQEEYIKTLDISELKFTFVDNGDDKTYILLQDQTQNSNLFFIGDYYEPFLDESNIMFGVSGDLVSVKKLNIRQCKRNSYGLKNFNKTNDSVQSCNCCYIF